MQWDYLRRAVFGLSLVPGCAGSGGTGQDGGATETTSAAGTVGGTDASSAASTDSSESTGMPDTCGDGVMDPGEACDDGNEMDHDGCNTDCTLTASTLWEDTVDGPVMGQDLGNAVVADAQGNLYLMGTLEVSVGANDAWVRKYDLEGTELWTQTYDGKAGLSDRWTSGALLADGDVLAVGHTFSSGNPEGRDIWVARLAPDGETRWTRTIDGTLADEANSANAVAADPDGGFYLVGREPTVNGDSDATVARYDDNGNELWKHTVDGGSQGQDSGRGVVVLANGDAVVSADVAAVEVDAGDVWLARYSPEGGQIWARVITPMDGVRESVRWLAVAPNDDLLLGGSIQDGTITARDISVQRLTSDGDEVWVATFDGGGAMDFATSIAVDSTDHTVLTGVVRPGPDGPEASAWIGKLSPDGDWVWTIDGRDDPAYDRHVRRQRHRAPRRHSGSGWVPPERRQRGL